MERYDSYKDSGVEWIGKIPSHWKNFNLGNIFTVSGRIGWKNLRSDEYVDEPNYIFLSTPNLKGKEIDFVNVNYITKERYDESPEIMLELDDILLVKSGSTLGIVNIIRELPKPTTVNGSSVVLKKRNESELGSFYNYLMGSNYFQNLMKITQGGVGVPSVNQSDIRKFKLLKPPISEQQQIVSFLDTKTSLIDSLIEKTQRKIELLKEKRTSLINEVVTKGLNPNIEMKDSGVEWIGEIPSGWNGGKLGYYSNVYRGSGYQYLNQVDEDYEGGKERVVRISDITEFNPILCEYQEQFENYRIQPDNILIGGTGHYFGKSIYVTKEMEGLIHSYNIIRVVIKNQYPKYVQYWLSSSKIREQMDISVLGSGQPFIDIQGLKDLHILIPPLSEQQQIVEYLDEQTQLIDKTISIEEKRIELLKEYRQSLISEVVTGKRKVVE